MTKKAVYHFGVSLNDAIFADRWNNKAYNELLRIQKLIKDGTIRYERLAQERFGGENEVDRIRRIGLSILGGRRSTSATIPKSKNGVRGQFDGNAAAIRAFAEYRGLWHDDAVDYVVRQMGCIFLDKGKEAYVYKDKGQKYVYKIKNYFFSRSLLQFFDELTTHNVLFPETKYEIIGFGSDERKCFCTILRQKAIEGRPATSDEIENYFKKDGFKRQNRYAYYKGGYIVSDLKPENVVYSNGKCFVIDCFAQTLLDFDNNFYIDNSTLHGITNAEMQSAELEIVNQARAIAQNGESLRQRYDSIVELYDSQRTIKPTDTKSKILQQYSTPCPLAFLASEYVKQHGGDKRYLEPSAGNGMLTISLPKGQTWVNELDEIRFQNLKSQGFDICTNQDASARIAAVEFDGVVTNPPFKSLPKDEQITVNGYTLATLDYKMAYSALSQMKDSGRAAVIVGGKLFDNYWKPLKGTDKKVLFGQWKVFLGWLYAAYNVEDLAYIGGDYIYRKQGTTYPVVLILIDGRRPKFDDTYKPRYIHDPARDQIITTYNELFDRIAPTILRHTTDIIVTSLVPSFNDGHPSPLLSKELELAKIFYKQNYLHGSSPEIPEIENTVSPELIAQIPDTVDDRRKFLMVELQRFEGTEIFCKYFGQNVFTVKKSINEICKWAAKSKESIIAALNLDGVVANAVKVNEDVPKPNKQTKEFHFIKMYEMHCNIKGIGTAKLMVGEHKKGNKYTYCITAIRI